ncbi:MAG: hypothetical protein OXU77_06735 [Gammaproteobacteria bacterium]|nr:hypothetical protein [Gammaproteobacteria bacterium]MDE0441367.1 hypothetical protein [Gammaproteobacteria bacterium]
MDTIATDNPFTTEEQGTLLGLVGAVIPPSAEFGTPGADDPAIAADILATARPYHAAVAKALSQIESTAAKQYDAAYTDLDAATRARIASDLSRSRFVGVGTLVTITAQCYYRDDRVMQSLGMEPRSPYPDGFDIPQGDWSLLEPVRQRARIYKEV